MARSMAARSARSSEITLVTSMSGPFQPRSADSLVQAHTGYRGNDSTGFHRRLSRIDHLGALRLPPPDYDLRPGGCAG
jgi:hypothetical protein